MSLANTLIPIAFLFSFLYLLYELFFLPKQKKLYHKPPSPPGPRPFPLIGNLHILGNLPHQTLQSLAKTYGSIMSLKLGQVPAIVISLSEAAQLIFKTNDIVFGTRPKTQAYDYLSCGFKGTAFAEYGPYWRHVKKLCTVQLLSAPKVDLFAPLRREELCLVLKSLQKASVSRKIVDLSEILHNLTEDIVFKMTFGPNTNKDNAFNYKDLVQEGMLVSDGYYIEKKTMVLVNIWGLGRDPKLWSDNAESFYPERFVDNDVDVRGHHFQLIPFVQVGDDHYKKKGIL